MKQHQNGLYSWQKTMVNNNIECVREIETQIDRQREREIDRRTDTETERKRYGEV